MEQAVTKLPLTQEERNDLRKRVLMGEALSVEEARAVIESCRTGAGVATLAGAEKKARKSKTPSISDEQLDADLAGLGLG